MIILKFFCNLYFFLKLFFFKKKCSLEKKIKIYSFNLTFKDSGLFDSIILLILEKYLLITIYSITFYSNFLIYEKASQVFFFILLNVKNYINIYNFNFFFFLKNILKVILVFYIILYLFL